MKHSNSWFALGTNMWTLGLEASQVMGLRGLKIATGAATQREICQMVEEKVEAGLALQALALTGGLGLTPQSAAAKTLAHYRRKVRANRRRLTRS